MYAHIALHRFSLLPGDFLNMERKERAFLIASIKVQLAKEKKDYDKIKNN